MKALEIYVCVVICVVTHSVIFLLKIPNLLKSLLPKTPKGLHDIPGRPVISNCGFYTENLSSFMNYHLQPLA